MRITKISVKGLFGMFDHEIPLNQESRITIVHGPNGVGKTVLMQLVHALFNYDYEFLGITFFDELNVEFEENRLLSLCKDDQDNLLINLRDGTHLQYCTFKCCSKPDTKAMEELLKETLPDLRPVLLPWARITQYWVSPKADAIVNSEVLTKEDLLHKYPSVHSEIYGEMPNWFAEIKREASPKLIVTERLVLDLMDMELRSALAIGEVFEGYVFPSPSSAVQDLSTKLNSRVLSLHPLKATIEETLRHAQAAKESLYESLEQLEEIRGGEIIEKIKGEIREAISSYEEIPNSTADMEYTYPEMAYDPKYGNYVFELWDYIWSTNLLVDIINERFLFKSLELREDDGLMFVSDNGDEVPTSSFSSGEQHLFILYYQLLFDIEPGTLVMIDEPELSMNVVWQRNFLKDLQRIIELRKFDVLIATHSPMIIHDKWDWVVHLGDKVDD